MRKLRGFSPVTSMSFGLLCASILSGSAQADTTMTVVSNYDKATDAAIWKKSSQEIPDSLLTQVKIPNPSMALAAPYSNIFLQNERMVVCYKRCDQPQNLKAVRNGSDYAIGGDGKSQASIVRQATVFYWINRLFDKLETLGFKPERRLVVMIDRDVKDPEIGVVQKNNAFFYDTNWTLSFLPAGTPLTYRLLGMDFGASANDPSVAMHEATHSVFQQLIGSILNREIFGLHEAFADYFALSILETPKLGSIIAKGKPLRSAESHPAYKPGMEAHDLGNVVLSAMWEIRGQFRDKNLADRIALETVREVSKNLYSQASDVVTAHLETVKRLGRDEVTANPALMDQIAASWARSGLNPSKPMIDASKLQGPVDESNSVTVTFRTEYTDETVREWATPKSETQTISQIARVVADPQQKLVWHKLAVATDKNPSAKPMWILMNEVTGSIEAALDESLQAVDLNDPVRSEQLLALGQNIGEATTLDKGFAREALQIYHIDANPILKWLIVVGSPQSSAGPKVVINDQAMQSTVYSKSVRLSLQARLAGLIDRQTVNEIVGSLRVSDLSILTVPTAQIGADTVLPKESRGAETVVGYQFTTLGGAKKSAIVRNAR